MTPDKERDLLKATLAELNDEEFLRVYKFMVALTERHAAGSQPGGEQEAAQ